MKCLVIALCLLFATPVFATLTVEEEMLVKNSYAQVQARNAYTSKVCERDALLANEDKKCVEAKDAIIKQYEAEITDLASRVIMAEKVK